MALNPLWQEDVFLTLQGFYPQVQLLRTTPYFVINCNAQLFIHLVPLHNQFDAAALIDLQLQFKHNSQYLVQLWEDVWLSKRTQVLSRLNSFLGLNQGFHGRKCTLVALDQKQASAFLETYHLQGAVKAKYAYGLLANNELIAAANFSAPRPMKSKGDQYQSAELVRFASKQGLTVIGGLSKLIRHFVKQVPVNDIMTYADRDWSIGKGYATLGFTLDRETPPAQMYVDQDSLARYFPHRLPKAILAAFDAQKILNLDEFLTLNGYHKVFNTGNLKYHLFI